MKKFLFVETTFFEPQEDKSKEENTEILNKIVDACYVAAEKNSASVEVQISPVFKPLSQDKYSLCYFVTAQYFEEV